MREIVLDTETTGLDPRNGDRIVEVACIELHHCVPTGRTYQTYINPQYPMSEGARRISGLTDDFLKDFPLFQHIVDDFITFIGPSPLVIHNAPFDIRFLNAELERINYPLLSTDRVTCTLDMARRLFPGSPASLDALCKRFEIDLSKRVQHGALLDSELLSEVYLHLTGGRQAHLAFSSQAGASTDPLTIPNTPTSFKSMKRPYLWTHQPTSDERNAHDAFIQKLKNPLWKTL